MGYGYVRFFIFYFVEVSNVFSPGFQWFTIMFPKLLLIAPHFKYYPLTYLG
jgi:hypothetical protein